MNELSTELIARLDTLSSKLGVASEHLWGVLVSQQALKALTDTIACSFFVILFLILATLSGIKCKRLLRKDPGADKPGTFGFAVLTVVSCFALLIILTAFLTGSPWFGLVNPEYYAARELLDLLK